MLYGNPGFGFFIVMFFFIIGVAFGLQYSESLSLRRHRMIAEKMRAEISSARDAESTIYELHIPLAIPSVLVFIGVIFLRPLQAFHWNTLIAITLFLFGIYIFLHYSRWSPFGEPIIRITNQNVYLYPSVQVSKSIPYWQDKNPFKKFSYYRGVTRISLENIRSVTWTGGGFVGNPLAIIIEVEEFIVLRKQRTVVSASKADYPYTISRYIYFTLTSPDALVSLLTGILPKKNLS